MSHYPDAKRALLELLRDRQWHHYSELQRIAGHHNGRIYDLEKDGWAIERRRSTSGEGCDYRLGAPAPSEGGRAPLKIIAEKHTGERKEILIYPAGTMSYRAVLDGESVSVVNVTARSVWEIVHAILSAAVAPGAKRGEAARESARAARFAATQLRIDEISSGAGCGPPPITFREWLKEQAHGGGGRISAAGGGA